MRVYVTTWDDKVRLPIDLDTESSMEKNVNDVLALRPSTSAKPAGYYVLRVEATGDLLTDEVR